MSSIAEALQTAILSSIAQAEIQRGEKICIAYSGGPDSIALLSLLHHLHNTFPLDLYAVYIDHGLRSKVDRRRELQIVLDNCETMGIPLCTQFLPPGYIAEHGAQEAGVEAAARSLRYKFLHKIRESVNARYIALGHTSDDQVETVLMRCFQGSGPEGLKGIRETTPALWRPLLRISKNELQSYISGQKLNYSIDTSNTDESYNRNYVRHTVLPAVRKVFTGVDGALLNLAEKMSAVEEVLEGQDLGFPRVTSNERGVHFSSTAFMSLPFYSRMRFLYKIYNSLYPDSEIRLPYRFIRQLCECDTKDEHYHCGEGYGVRMEKRGKMLFWERAVVPNTKNSYLIVVQTGNFYVGSGVTLGIQRKSLEDFRDSALRGMVFAVKEPCVIRSRRSGDSVALGGGTKKIKEVLRELKVPQEKRTEVALIEDRRGILGVVPLYEPQKTRWSRYAESFKGADTAFEITSIERSCQ